MRIFEVRTPLPFTVDEFHVANLFALSVMKKTSPDVRDSYENLMINGEDYGFGVYEEHRYNVNLPLCFNYFVPNSWMNMEKRTWNSLLFSKTETKNPSYMKEHFIIEVEKMFHADNSIQANVFNLDENELVARKVKWLDPITDPTMNEGISNTRLFGRGPLSNNWKVNSENVIWVYIKIKVIFDFRGLKGVMERKIAERELQKVEQYFECMFSKFEQWYKLTKSEIRLMELEIGLSYEDASEHERFTGLYHQFALFGSRGGPRISVYNTLKWFSQTPVCHVFNILQEDIQTGFFHVSERDHFLEESTFSNEFLNHIADILSVPERPVTKEDLVMYLIRAGTPKTTV